MFTKFFRFTGCFLLVLLILKPAFSQFQINHFTTENGLPSNGIKGLQWDTKTGFLWIATEAGMVRYNGISFKIFDAGTNPELGSGRIVKLVKNMAGKILVASDEGHLSAVKKNTLLLRFKDGKLAKYNYNYFGAISASDTLFRQCFKTPWPVYFSINLTTVVPVNDTMCLALNEGDLYRYSVSTVQPLKLPTGTSFIKNVFKIDERVFYLDSVNEVYSFNVIQNTFQKEKLYATNGSTFSIEEKNSKLFWQAGMQEPIMIQHGNAWVIESDDNRKLQCRLIASGISENALYNYAQYKKDGNYLFLGSDSKGIYIIHRNQLITKQPVVRNMSQNNSFYSQIELPDGNVLTNQGVIIGDAGRQNTYNIGDGFVKTVYTIKDSLLIYAYRDSVFRYNIKTHNRQLMFVTHINLTFGVANSGKDLYFANQMGIGIINENGSLDFLKYFDEKTNILLGITSMIEMAPGKLALATCTGLLSFDIATKKIDTLLQLPAVCIRSLHKEGNYIFIGTYGGGFYVMKNGILKAIPLDVNQYLKYTHCFIKDDNGFYWISTNNGLFKVKASDITDAYEKNLRQVYYHYFGKEDGMETTEMNGGCTPCAIRLGNRNFSFPTMDGLVWVNPEKAFVSLPSGDIFIDKILVDGKEQPISGNNVIQLPQQTKKADFSFAVNAWCKKENLYIAYKLNNDPWLKVDMVADEPRIAFNNLSYGNYNLTIRKLNGFGIDNYSYSTIAFKIATPFYHQWWFRILGLLALAGIGYLIFRMRLRQYDIRERKLSALVDEKTLDLNLKNAALEKNDQIKTRLISVINHDIITPLKFMHYAGKALIENKGLIEPEQQLETIADITQTAKDMEVLSSQILNWIIYQNPNQRMQKEEFDLHQLVEMVFGVLKFPARLKNTTLHNRVPVNFVVYQYLEPLRVLVYNLLLNAVNFTKAGSVTIECQLAEGRVVVEVKDNGLGMTEEQINNLLSDEKIIASANVDNKKGTGLGYMIIKDLLKMMEGTLSISSTKGNGTTVSVSLPLK